VRRRLAALAVAGCAALAGCAVGDPQPTTSVTHVSASLEAEIHSSFAGDTQYWWRYGTTTAYGTETAHETIAIADSDPHHVSKHVAGLAASTTYHFQLCVQDEEESPPRTVCSTDRTFTTDPEPDGSEIAFISDRLGTDDVWVMDSNGNFHVDLTDTASFYEAQPTWTEDRSKIAYLGDGGVHVMDADGSNDTTLPNTGDVFDPAWSPDGEQIAFSRSGGLYSEIWIMDADGSDQTKVTDNDATELVDSGPAWSPDGAQIVFTRQTFGPVSTEALALVGPGGGSVVPITDHGVEPDWSPDGDRIVFTSFKDGDWEIYVVDADGANEDNLTDEDSVDTSPSWSPDGSRIAYERLEVGSDWNDIYVMDADGSGKLNYTEGSDFVDETDPDWSSIP
jgi:Tol biopolymer transport system component